MAPGMVQPSNHASNELLTTNKALEPFGFFLNAFRPKMEANRRSNERERNNAPSNLSRKRNKRCMRLLSQSRCVALLTADSDWPMWPGPATDPRPFT